MSVSMSCIVRSFGGGVVLDLLNLLDKLADLAELAVDTHEANVGDLVEVAEPTNDVVTELLAGRLAIVVAKQVFLDQVHELVDLLIADGKLVASLLDAGDQLVPPVGYASAVLLDYGEP